MKSQRPNSPTKYNTGPNKSGIQEQLNVSIQSGDSAVIKQAIIAVQSIVIQGLATVQAIVALNERQNASSMSSPPINSKPSPKPQQRKQSLQLSSRPPPLKQQTSLPSQEQKTLEQRPSISNEQSKNSISEEHTHQRNLSTEDIVYNELQSSDINGRPSLEHKLITETSKLDDMSSSSNNSCCQKSSDTSSHQEIYSEQELKNDEEIPRKNLSDELIYVQNFQKSVEGIIAKTEEILYQNQPQTPK